MEKGQEGARGTRVCGGRGVLEALRGRGPACYQRGTASPGRTHRTVSRGIPTLGGLALYPL